MKNPTEKVRSIYFVLYSKGLPRSFYSLAMTNKIKYVILNDSEESHRKSAEVYALSVKSWDISLVLNMTYLFWGIAAVATLLRNDGLFSVSLHQ